MVSENKSQEKRRKTKEDDMFFVETPIFDLMIPPSPIMVNPLTSIVSLDQIKKHPNLPHT